MTRRSNWPSFARTELRCFSALPANGLTSRLTLLPVCFSYASTAFEKPANHGDWLMTIVIGTTFGVRTGVARASARRPRRRAAQLRTRPSGRASRTHVEGAARQFRGERSCHSSWGLAARRCSDRWFATRTRAHFRLRKLTARCNVYTNKQMVFVSRRRRNRGGGRRAARRVSGRGRGTRRVRSRSRRSRCITRSRRTCSFICAPDAGRRGSSCRPRSRSAVTTA